MEVILKVSLGDSNQHPKISRENLVIMASDNNAQIFTTLLPKNV